LFSFYERCCICIVQNRIFFLLRKPPSSKWVGKRPLLCVAVRRCRNAPLRR
jgi:hypothetical protein